MGKPRVCIAEAVFDKDIKTVWDTISDNVEFNWRSDLKNIKIFNENEWIEENHSGYKTRFKIVKKEPYSFYEFKIENNLFYGSWIGKFKSQDNKTRVIFTEEIYINNFILRLFSYFAFNIKKLQQTYIEDLRKELTKK